MLEELKWLLFVGYHLNTLVGTDLFSYTVP